MTWQWLVLVAAAGLGAAVVGCGDDDASPYDFTPDRLGLPYWPCC